MFPLQVQTKSSTRGQLQTQVNKISVGKFVNHKLYDNFVKIQSGISSK